MDSFRGNPLLDDLFQYILAAKQSLTDAYFYDFYGHQGRTPVPQQEDSQTSSGLSSLNTTSSTDWRRPDQGSLTADGSLFHIHHYVSHSYRTLDIRNLSDAEILSLTQNIKDHEASGRVG